MDDTRELLKRMRGKEYVAETKSEEPKKEMDMRDMLKKTRTFVNEDVETNTSLDNSDVQTAQPNDGENVITYKDPTDEKEKFKNFFDDMNVHIDFNTPLEVKDDSVFWGGVIDGVIQFDYKVTPDDDTSGVVLQYLREGFENSETAQEIVERLKSYYDTFYKYWNGNLPEKKAEPQTIQMNTKPEQDLQAAAE